MVKLSAYAALVSPARQVAAHAAQAQVVGGAGSVSAERAAAHRARRWGERQRPADHRRSPPRPQRAPAAATGAPGARPRICQVCADRHLSRPGKDMRDVHGMATLRPRFGEGRRTSRDGQLLPLLADHRCSRCRSSQPTARHDVRAMATQETIHVLAHVPPSGAPCCTHARDDDASSRRSRQACAAAARGCLCRSARQMPLLRDERNMPALA